MPSLSEQIAFGLDRETSEKSLALLLERLARPDMARLFAGRLSTEEMETLADTILSLVNRHFSHAEYHRFFLEET